MAAVDDLRATLREVLDMLTRSSALVDADDSGASLRLTAEEWRRVRELAAAPDFTCDCCDWAGNEPAIDPEHGHFFCPACGSRSVGDDD